MTDRPLDGHRLWGGGSSPLASEHDLLQRNDSPFFSYFSHIFSHIFLIFFLKGSRTWPLLFHHLLLCKTCKECLPAQENGKMSQNSYLLWDTLHLQATSAMGIFWSESSICDAHRGPCTLLTRGDWSFSKCFLVADCCCRQIHFEILDKYILKF